jgi:dolichol-phosphate mannosyltransferase
MKPDISIIIPFLNEEESIPSLVLSLNSYFSDFGPTVEVVFVDDGSTDNSVALLKSATHTSYSCKIVKLSRNYGSLPALNAGILHASGDITSFLYADLQDPIELIGRLYEKYREGNEIVWACRNFAKGDSRFFSKLYAKLMRKYAIPNFPENGFDVVMFSESVKNELNANIESNSSIFLQILNFGFRQDYIYYDKVDRKAGVSKWTFAQKFKLVVDSFVAFSYAPVRFVTVMGIIFSAIGFLWMLFIVGYTLLVGGLPLGLPATISVLLMGFGITNISLGVIAEYLWRTLDASRRRKPFIVNEVIDLTEAIEEHTA